MPWFHYTALDDQGNPVGGRVQGTDAAQVQTLLLEKGFLGVSVLPDTPTRGALRATPRELAVLAQQFAVVIRSDITLVEGVETLIAQNQNRHIKAALENVREQISRGESFADAMAGHAGVFPAYYRSMIRIGEVSGSLDSVFERLAQYYEKEHKLSRRVKTAVTYPIILSVMMLGVIALLILRVLPMFHDILLGLGGAMPGLTVAILGVGEVLSRHGWWMLLALLLILFGPRLVGLLTPSGTLWYDQYRLRAPVMGSIRRQLITARFSQSFALLIRSGVSVTVSLSMAADLLGNRYVAQKLGECAREVETGQPLSTALERTGLFPPLLIRMVSVGQKTGRLDDILMNTSTLFDEELDTALDRMTASIEPALIILLSIIVGVVLFAVMLPMINILSAI